LYISPGHFAQPKISYKGIFSKKNVAKNGNNKLYSKGHIRVANPSALAFFKLYDMAHFRLCHVNTEDLLGRAIFRSVLSDFPHACNRLRVYGGRISGNKCVRGAMIH